MATKIKTIRSHVSPELVTSFNNMLSSGGRANIKRLFPKLAKMMKSCTVIERILVKIAKTDLSNDEQKSQINNWIEENSFFNYIITREQVNKSDDITEYDIYKRISNKEHSEIAKAITPSIIKSMWKLFYEFEDYCKTINKSLTDKDLDKDIEVITWCESKSDKLGDELLIAFNEFFSELKKVNCINVFIIICNNLNKYKVFLNFDVKQPIPENSLNFIKRLVGDEFYPLNEITNVNFCKVYNMDNIPNIKTLVVLTLSQLYTFTKHIYSYIMSPDIDIERFSSIMVEHIAQARATIPRCKEAFDAIESSMNLLNDNFDNYYKDFVTTKNPASIMEGYILDICESKAASNGRIISQFRRIIDHFRKASRYNAQSPQINSLLRSMENKYKMLDVESSKMPDITDEDLTVQNAITKSKNQKRHERRKKKREMENNTNKENIDNDPSMYRNDEIIEKNNCELVDEE
jgi:hypothetical protein